MSSRLHIIIGAAALSLLASPPTVFAQDAPTAPFHAGQLGANIAINGLTFSSVDLLKFTSPTRAWVLSASAFGNSVHATGGLPSTTNSDEGFNLSLQRRFLRPTRAHVVLYLSPGILGGFSHSSFSGGPGLSTSAKTWDAGVLLEAGAEYLIGTHLGLGARYRASVTYDRFDVGGSRLWSINASAGDIGAFGALFF